MNSPIRASTCCHRLTWCGYSVLSRSNTQVSIWPKARDEAFFIISHPLSCPRRRASSTPRRSNNSRMSASTGSPAFAGDDNGCTRRVGASRQRKPQRLAAAGHVDGREADRGEAAAAAVALLGELELALAGAELFSAAPVQWFVLDPDGAVLAVDRFGKAENLPGLAGDVGVQALAGIDAIPPAAGDGLAVVGRDRGHDLVRRVVAPGQPGGRRRLHRVDHGGEEIR